MKKIIRAGENILVRKSLLAEILDVPYNSITYFAAKYKVKRVGINKKWYDLRMWLVLFYGPEVGAQKYEEYHKNMEG